MTWSDEGGDVSCEVRVRNISGGGAAVLTAGGPRPGQEVRLRLDGEAREMGTVDAEVMAVDQDEMGRRMVRLRFAHWIPLDWILDRHRDRRLWERYPARESRAFLTWLEGTTERMTVGDLLNISGGGAAFAADVIPTSGVEIRLRLEAGDRRTNPVDPIEGRLVDTSVDPSGMRIAHIQFLGPCPMDLFELAVQSAE